MRYLLASPINRTPYAYAHAHNLPYYVCKGCQQASMLLQCTQSNALRVRDAVAARGVCALQSSTGLQIK